MLAQRIKTAAVLLVILATSLYFGGWLLIFASLVVVGIIHYEFYSFASSYPTHRKLQLISIGLLLPIAYIFAGWQGFLLALWLGIILSFAIHLIEIQTAEHLPEVQSSVATACLGFVYCSILSSLIVVLAINQAGNILITWLFAVVIASDTAAYFSGKLIGGQKLAPRISPNKTLAGAVGGLVAAALAGVLAASLLPISTHWLAVLFYSLMAGLLAQTGDLAESLIKRIYKVKDSSQLLPGHGGVLDRLDAIIFAAPLAMFLEVQSYA